MKYFQFRQLVVFVVLLISALGVWDHSFEHIQSQDQDQCEILVHQNVDSSHWTGASIEVISHPIEFNIYSLQDALVPSQEDKSPPSNNSPPLSYLT